jgi:hypothetical protein
MSDKRSCSSTCARKPCVHYDVINPDRFDHREPYTISLTLAAARKTPAASEPVARIKTIDHAPCDTAFRPLLSMTDRLVLDDSSPIFDELPYPARRSATADRMQKSVETPSPKSCRNGRISFRQRDTRGHALANICDLFMSRWLEIRRVNIPGEHHGSSSAEPRLANNSKCLPLVAASARGHTTLLM